MYNPRGGAGPPSPRHPEKGRGKGWRVDRCEGQGVPGAGWGQGVSRRKGRRGFRKHRRDFRKHIFFAGVLFHERLSMPRKGGAPNENADPLLQGLPTRKARSQKTVFAEVSAVFAEASACLLGVPPSPCPTPASTPCPSHPSPHPFFYPMRAITLRPSPPHPQLFPKSGT